MSDSESGTQDEVVQASQPRNAQEHQEPQVVVQYAFRNLPDRIANNLPQRVEAAVTELIRRERIPSDDDVRHLLFADESQDLEGNTEASVNMMLPQSVAVDVAMDRSFREGGNKVQEAELTSRDIRILTRRSRFARLARLRQCATRMSLASARVEMPVDECIICMERVRYRANRIILECNHAFHRDCVIGWLKQLPRKCPVCRTVVDLTPRHNEGACNRFTRSTRCNSHPFESMNEVTF